MEEEIIRFPKIASFSQVAYGRILRALSLSGAWKVHVKLYYRMGYFEYLPCLQVIKRRD